MRLYQTYDIIYKQSLLAVIVLFNHHILVNLFISLELTRPLVTPVGPRPIWRMSLLTYNGEHYVLDISPANGFISVLVNLIKSLSYDRDERIFEKGSEQIFKYIQTNSTSFKNYANIYIFLNEIFTN